MGTSAGIRCMLSRVEAAFYLEVAPGTLARWASMRTGPRYVLVGRKARYRVADLNAYIETKVREPLADGAVGRAHGGVGR